MAERGNGLVGPVEVTDDVENSGIEAEILWRTAAGDNKAVILRRIDLVESCVEREVVATFFRIGLIALEVMDGGADLIAFLLAGADGVDRVADHLQSLEWDHDLVVLNKIAGEKQKLLGFHDANSSAPSLPQEADSAVKGGSQPGTEGSRRAILHEK